MPDRMCLRDRPPPFSPGRDGHEHLGGDDHFVAAQHLAHEISGGHLAGAARVGVGRVEEGDSALDRGAHDGLGRGLVEDPLPLTVVPEAHHAETDARDSQCRFFPGSRTA